MSPVVLFMLMVFLVWATLLAYVYVQRRSADAGAGGRSALLTLMTVLIPVVLLVLWHQHQSVNRLEALGFVPHPGLHNSIGVATGSGAQPVWLFELNAPVADVIDFYRQPQHHAGWQLLAQTSQGLLFERGNSRLAVELSEDKAAFILHPRSAASDP